MLVSGTRAFCTRHPRSPLELTYSPERSPRLPDSSKSSGTPCIISYDSHPFFLGHHVHFTHALDPTARCEILENSLLVAR